MQLYIIRHAEAQPIPAGGNDAMRALTSEGLRQSEEAARALVRLGARPTRIWSSGLTRAQQTAEILQANLPDRPGIEIRDFLSIPGDFDRLRKGLRELMDVDELILVGHMPFLGESIQYWLTGHAHPGLQVPKASIICLEAEDGFNRGTMTLKYWLNRKVIRKLKKKGKTNDNAENA